MTTYTTMRPEVQRVQALQDFVTTMCNTCCENIRAIRAAAPNTEPFQTACMSIVRLLDIISVLNFMKMFNSSIMNDFAMFKRSFQQIRGELRADEAEQVAQQSHALHFFLANPNSIVDAVKAAVEKEPGFDEALVLVLDATIAALSTSPALPLTTEKCALLRSTVYLIYVIDGPKCNAFKLKSVKGARGVIKLNPNIPVHGQLLLTSLVVLKSAPNWDDAMERDWTQTDESCAIL
eukprot:c5413_g1_i2.p1 GENE.c5413_g1_i2~~c5413_g1_i2.p1  ORF type:complete len:235 (+),score=51.95 c5413_g1_i2:365-1069(+)